MCDAQDEILKRDTNNFIIQQKKSVKQVSKNVLNIIRCNIMRLRSKLKKNEKLEKKLQSKIQKYNEEISFIKGFHVCDVMKFALINKFTFKEVITQANCTTEQKALYRLIDQQVITKSVSDFLDAHPEMKDNLHAASIIYGLGSKQKKKDKKQLQADKQRLQTWLDSYAKLPRTAAVSILMNIKNKSKKTKSNSAGEFSSNKVNKNKSSQYSELMENMNHNISPQKYANNTAKPKIIQTKRQLLASNNDSDTSDKNVIINNQIKKRTKINKANLNGEDDNILPAQKFLSSKKHPSKTVTQCIAVTKLGQNVLPFKGVKRRKLNLPDDESSEEDEEEKDIKLDKNFFATTARDDDGEENIFDSANDKYFNENLFKSKHLSGLPAHVKSKFKR